MDDTLKTIMREHLLECYGVDIERAKCHFSTQNYAFVFPGEPFMIRVSVTPKKTRSEILSELMWLDDLKQFKQTICEPNVSLKGNLLEEYQIIFRIRDDGQEFNPLMCNDEDERSLGISMVRQLAKDIRYSRAIGMNNLTVII